MSTARLRAQRVGEGFAPYRWAASVEDVAGRHGIRPEAILKFDQNTPPLPGVPQVPLARSMSRLEQYPDGTYRAFGDTYALVDFPRLVAAAPKGLFMVGPPALRLDGDEGTGEQPLCFVEQTEHDMRIGWYTDTYRRTEQGWRIRTRSMTFLRRSGARDSGRPHDPDRPLPGT